MEDRGPKLTILDDPLGIIRTHPNMYLGAGPLGPTIAQALLGDALLLGALHVFAERRNDWFVVGADVDWLTAPCRVQLPVVDLFKRIVPLPEAGANSMRAEVLVAAFASSAIALTTDSELLICGARPPAELAERLLPQGIQRTIAFTLS